MNKIKIFFNNPISHKNGKIIIFEKSKNINFKFNRVFIVKSDKNQIRGKHAHKKCTQLLNCPNGKVEIFCEDKNNMKKKFVLNKPEKFLVVPPMVWCIQKYKKNNSSLLVICDKKYSKNDYIRDYSKFKGNWFNIKFLDPCF